MSQVEITDAAADLAGLVARARGGEEVILVNEGQAVARLIAVSGNVATREPRVLGRLEGQMRVPDDFDAPLPDDLLDLFEGRT